MLQDFGILEGTDKVWHGYLPLYEQRFGLKRAAVRNVLEVGIDKGSSLRMWKKFFPNATILGLDNDPATMFEEERIRTHVADQANLGDLRKVVLDYLVTLCDPVVLNAFDLVIDDGSHDPRHQVTTYKALSPLVKDGGFYVVEDFYPSRFGPEFLDLLRTLIGAQNFWKEGMDEEPPPTRLKSITTYRGIIFIEVGKGETR